MGKRTKPSLGCGYVVFVILLLIGGALLALPAQAGSGVDAGRIVAGVFGFGILFGAFSYLRFMRRAVGRHEESERIAAANPDKPWLLRPEWRAPAIESKEGQGAVVFWVFALFWNGISGAATWAVLTKEHNDNGVYFVLLFPLVGVFLLWGAIHQTIKWRKFGRVRFVPTSLPGVVGGYLGGVVEVPMRLVLESDAKVALRCVRRVTRGSGKNRRTDETVLWEKEEAVARDQWMGATDRTDIPVLFYIPPECQEWNDDNANDQIVWRLAAGAAVPGVDFSATFEVPVFRTGETAAPPEPGQPLLAEYRAGPGDAATLASSGVEILADGFRFTSGHLVVGRVMATVVFLGLAALTLFMLGSGAQFVLVGLAGFFAMLAAFFAGDLWSGKFEVRMVGPEVVVTQFRPWGAKVTRVPRAEVADVRAKVGMSSGDKRFYQLSLLGVDGVDPRQPATAEGFAARKLRSRLERLARELGAPDPTKMGERGEQILEEMRRTPRFRVVIAKHLPGQSTAESVAAAVLERIRGR